MARVTHAIVGAADSEGDTAAPGSSAWLADPARFCAPKLQLSLTFVQFLKGCIE